MAEIDACITNGTTDEIMEIIGRFRWLPEFGMADAISRVNVLGVAVHDAEIVLSQAKTKLVSNALGLLERVRKDWTAEDIHQATGYAG